MKEVEDMMVLIKGDNFKISENRGFAKRRNFFMKLIYEMKKRIKLKKMLTEDFIRLGKDDDVGVLSKVFFSLSLSLFLSFSTWPKYHFNIYIKMVDQ